MALTFLRRAALAARTLIGLPPALGVRNVIDPHSLEPAIVVDVAQSDTGDTTYSFQMSLLRRLPLGKHALYLSPGPHPSEYIADPARVMAWMQQDPRPSPQAAFTAGPERQAAYWIEMGAWALKQPAIAAELRVGAAIGYPEEWDTAAYPTVWDALDETVAHAEFDCDPL